MKTILERSVQTIALCLITASVAAHHSTSMFDTQREIVLRGIVTTFKWGNPHVYVTIETENAAGETAIIEIEGPAPMALTIAGWSERSLTPGARVLVVANPSRDPNSTMVLGNSVLIEGGEYLPMGGIRLQKAFAAQRER